MSARVDKRSEIAAALGDFGKSPLLDAAKCLFGTLGYTSERRLPISKVSQFLRDMDPGKKLTARDRDALETLRSLHLLFQLTDAELTSQQGLFDDRTAVETTQIHSYLFFAAELPPGQYTRTALSTLVRAINKPLPMPAMVLFRYGELVSIGIIHRRLHKRDQSKDVLEKVTLIKDISCSDPIRAHLEILNDFALANLDADFDVPNFVRLHEAWQKRLGSYALSNDFYREIADWYFWALHQVADGTIRLPQHCDTEQEQSLFLIRLLTRVIFCWFLVEKRLIPSDLFRDNWLKAHLKKFTPSRDPKQPDTSPTYYHAILQNLFFGTLNMPSEQRAFREKKKEGERYDKNYGITNLWRYETDFRDPKEWVEIATHIPFLNGGLFDCLDDKSGKAKDNFILDGFSDNPKLTCLLPNDLFFGPERSVDLSHDYGEEKKKTARSKKAKVRGLIEILSRYKFTVEENTPLEEEIALDPELLGKVFENLLASYNEDTRTTARKALGAFYTPREIVNYMVDEALKSYLANQVPRCKGALDDLFSNKATLKEVKSDTRDALIAAIGRVKILDPACGSGAFPMGSLHRLVDLLQKLDANNEKWRELQRRRAVIETEVAFKSGDRESREVRLKEINDTFEFNSSDYGRKLYLIENSIYGVDIQPIATQIAKLRFFIALVVDQKIDRDAPNFGVRPLPNLETRLVAADTLIPIEKSQRDLFSDEIDRLRADLASIRHEHFNARSPSAKRRWREADAAKRKEIADYLDREHAIPCEAAKKLADWDPYDQNTFAPFFDAEWMFGIRPENGLRADSNQNAKPDCGFDIVVGNPPYLDSEEMKRNQPTTRAFISEHYKMTKGNWDMYIAFYERAFTFLKRSGVVTFITPDKWIAKPFGDSLRLGTHDKLVAILRAGRDVFQTVNVDAIVTIYVNEPSNVLKVLNIEDGTVRLKRTIDKSILPPPYAYDWLFSRWFELLQRIETIGGRLRDVGDCQNACATSDAYKLKPFIENRCKQTSAADYYRVVNTGTIGKFASKWGHRDMTYLGDTYKCPVVKRSTFHREFKNTYGAKAPQPKLIGKGLNLLDVCIDPSGSVIPGKTTLIVTAPDLRRLKYLLGALNSPVPFFYITEKNPAYSYNQGTTFTTDMINALPLPSVVDAQLQLLCRLVDMLIDMHETFNQDEPTPRDKLMLAYWERVLNGLLYELYFSEEVHGADLRIFELVEDVRLPDIGDIAESKRVTILRDKFEDIYEGSHPLRIALDKLQTLDTVRIVEGKA